MRCAGWLPTPDDKAVVMVAQTGTGIRHLGMSGPLRLQFCSA